MASELHVVFVCLGNICRSPIAERVARQQAAEAGLVGVRFSSAALSSEEAGNPMDPRARRVLEAAGYEAAGHRARQLGAQDIEGADLVVAMEEFQITRLRRLAPDAEHLRLLTDFDPAATPGSPVEDPWYGPESAFTETLSAVESAMPGLLAHLRSLTGGTRGL